MDYSSILRELNILTKNMQLLTTTENLFSKGIIDDHGMIYYYYPKDVQTKEKGIPFAIKNKTQYNEIIKKIIQMFGDISDSISFTSFNKFLTDNLCYYIVQNKNIQKGDVKKIHNILLEKPLIKYSVVRPLYGAYSKEVEPINLGIFTIYNVEFHDNELQKKSFFWNHRPEDWCDKSINLFVTVDAVARDAIKADEISENNFQLFDDILSYIFGSLDHAPRIGVLSYRRPIPLPVACLGDKDAMISGERIPIQDILPLFLSVKSLNDESQGYQTLWRVLALSNINEMQKSLISSIEWMGKGIRSGNIIHSYLFYCIAIESLLNTGKGESLTQRLAENAAFILSRQCEERMRIDARVKHLYEIRSNITHGSNFQIEKSDLLDIYNISKQLTTKFLTTKALMNLKNKDGLKSWIIHQRYS